MSSPIVLCCSVELVVELRSGSRRRSACWARSAATRRDFAVHLRLLQGAPVALGKYGKIMGNIYENMGIMMINHDKPGDF